MRIALLLVLLALGALAVAHSGLYNVAASEPHGPVFETLLHTAMRRSVERRAAGLAAPDLRGEERVSEGLTHYAAMCETCHGAPEGEPSELARGLYPPPPPLAENDLDWTDEEIFWIVEHGLKLTGMPGFGASHDDDALWSIVGAVRALPRMDAAGYRAATRPAGPPAAAHDHSAHDHSAHGH